MDSLRLLRLVLNPELTLAAQMRTCVSNDSFDERESFVTSV